VPHTTPPSKRNHDRWNFEMNIMNIMIPFICVSSSAVLNNFYYWNYFIFISATTIDIRHHPQLHCKIIIIIKGSLSWTDTLGVCNVCIYSMGCVCVCVSACLHWQLCWKLKTNWGSLVGWGRECVEWTFCCNVSKCVH
jgi:hypothetical protein